MRPESRVRPSTLTGSTTPSRGSLPRLLVFIPSFDAARHIEWVISRIPVDLDDRYQTHILAVDDASTDGTPTIARRALERSAIPYGWSILVNPVNQGYGGNQKLGYTFAIERGYDVVVMVHGDGQYPPEAIHELATVALEHGAAFGSRFQVRGLAIKGGMPYYKWVGNRILTSMQNRLLGTHLTEFHSGFRAYTTQALRGIPFQLNSNGFVFDTEIFIQLLRRGIRIAEIAIPTHYGDEECHVQGLRYARSVTMETLKSRLHDLGLLYERKFDVGLPLSNTEPKTHFDSPSSRVLKKVTAGSTVLHLGAGNVDLARRLTEAGCTVIGVDLHEVEDSSPFTKFVAHDLEEGFPDIDADIDAVALLDIIEHFHRPEEFVEQLRDFSIHHGVRQIYVSTANVAFVITRFSLLAGQFNYGPRGILDMTHKRLFTFRTMRKLFEQAGFVVEQVEGVPAPYELAVGPGSTSRILTTLNRWLIHLSRGLFSYQALFTIRPPIPLHRLIAESTAHAESLAEADIE